MRIDFVVSRFHGFVIRKKKNCQDFFLSKSKFWNLVFILRIARDAMWLVVPINQFDNLITPPLCASNKPLLRCHPSSFTSCVSLEQQAPPLLSPSIIHFLCLLNNNIWHRKWSHLLFCHTPDGYMHNTNISEKFQRLKQKKYFFVIYREGIFASRAQRSEAKNPPLYITTNGGRDAEDQQRGQFEKSLRKMCGSLLTILIPQWEYPSYSRSTCDKFVLCSSSWSSSPPSPSPPPPPSPSFPSSLPGSPYFYFQGNPVEKTFSLANQKETTFILAIVWDFLSLIPDKREVFKWFLICLLNQFSDVFSCCSDD